MRILYHAINGGGLGHVVRLANIAQEAREIDASVHQLIVTYSSPSDYLDRLGMPALVLPHDDTGSTFGSDRRTRTVTYRLGVQMLYRVIGEYNPDIVVFDTHFSISLVRQLLADKRPMALILRKAKPAYLEDLFAKPELGSFRRILAPHHPAEFREPHPKIAERFEALEAFRYTGPIVRRFDVSSESIERVSRKYGIQPGRPLIIIACGAGGYPEATRQFLGMASHAAWLAARKTGAAVLAVTGPYACADSVAEGCPAVPWEPELPLLMVRANLVVSHAGYNSVNEILAAGCRAVLIPAPRKHEDQAERASRLARSGRVELLALDTAPSIAAVCFEEEMRKPPFKPETFEGGHRAAAELLSLRCLTWLASSVRDVPTNAQCFGDIGMLAGAIQQISECGILIDAPRLEMLLREVGAFRSVGAWIVRLCGASPDEVSERAGDSLDLCASAGLDPRRLTLAYFDPCGGRWLPRVAELLAGRSFHALVAEVPPRARVTTSESFPIFEHWRDLGRPFLIDISTSGCPFVDQP